ncbi:transglycosylase domain-containing protein [Priestia filamentosa]|uniref:transglycosylase domain-containing protein n=1 Tax=Priestia filamentosa TaxID=1402861 RepID=UPI0002F6F850|nr:transglycosylase domain-containing protein [Priestia filamentosa]
MYKKGIVAGGIVVGLLLVGVIGYFIIILLGDYIIDEKKLVLNSATTLVDQNGKEITKLYVENRDPVPIEDIPDHVKEAFIATEDVRFYEHNGIDLKSISRAVYKNILAGGKAEGASTITQQLAKNVFLSNEKTFLRKGKEAIIAMNLENRYSKDKILEMYLNQVYLGQGAYGVQAASHVYFNKDVSELTADQSAVLAAMLKAPTTYSPILNPDKSLERRNVVLGLMEKSGYLSAKETVRLQGKTLGTDVVTRAKEPSYFTYFDMVMEEAKDRYSLSNEELLRGGYEITVPLNTSVQKKAYELFQEGSYFPGTDDSVQGAFVLLDNKTGGVTAAIGGRDYVQKGLNRLNIKRQPGSTFKPLAVYGPALEEKKFKPYSLLRDEVVSYNGYEPHNAHEEYRGKITMYDALKDSVNTSAVWTLNKLGVPKSKEYLEKLHMPIEDNGLAIALGGLREGVTPLQIASAYQTFANGGVHVEPHFITKIQTADGEAVKKTEKVKKERVFSKQTSWYMTKMLQAVVEDGTATAGTFSGALAGKTGTTTFPNVKGANKDVWFAGYTPQYTGTVWMGYDKTNSSHYLTGGSSKPTILFKDILSQSSIETKESFKKPKKTKDLKDPIRLEKIDDLTGDKGVFSLTLEWTPSEDKRVVYYIYEEKEGETKLVGKVKGKGKYEVEGANVFSSSTFYVIPYNTQTKERGEKSNKVSPSLFGFQAS